MSEGGVQSGSGRDWLKLTLGFIVRPVTTISSLFYGSGTSASSAAAANSIANVCSLSHLYYGQILTLEPICRKQAVARTPSPPPSLPTPFSFLSSAFSLSLILTAILVNRIHHLVPPRRPSSNALSPYLLLCLRLPSLLLLLRSICLLGAVLSLANGYNPFFDYPSLTFVTKLLLKATFWAGKGILPRLLPSGSSLDGITQDAGSENAAVLWQVFLGVGLSVITEAFVRALNDNLEETQGFNLLSVSHTPTTFFSLV